MQDRHAVLIVAGQQVGGGDAVGDHRRPDHLGDLIGQQGCDAVGGIEFRDGPGEADRAPIAADVHKWHVDAGHEVIR